MLPGVIVCSLGFWVQDLGVPDAMVYSSGFWGLDL